MLTEVVGVQMHFTVDKHCALGKRNPTLIAPCQEFLPKHKYTNHSWNYYLLQGLTPPAILDATFSCSKSFLVCVAWSYHPLESSASEDQRNILENGYNNNTKLLQNLILGKKNKIYLELLASCFSPPLCTAQSLAYSYFLDCAIKIYITEMNSLTQQIRVNIS